MEEAISGLDETAPCVVAFGATRDSISDVKVVKENKILCPCVTSLQHFIFAFHFIMYLTFHFWSVLSLSSYF